MLALELRRTRRLRWLTLPLTLPVIPRWLRFRGLDLLFRLKAARAAGDAAPAQHYGFDETALAIERDGRPSVNLVATAH